MTTHETRKYEMLVRVRAFGDAHTALFPASTVGGQAFAAVTAAVEQLSSHATAKMSTQQEGKSTKALAREALFERLTATTQAARIIEGETPGFADQFPAPRKKQPDQTLLTAGRVFIQHAAADKSRFIAVGMRDTFVEDLTRLVDEFQAALLEREAGWDGQVRARAGITAAIALGLVAARKLDIVVADQFAGDPLTLAVWERDQRVENPPRRRRVATTTTTVPSSEVPPTPATTAEPVPSTPSAATPTPLTATPSAKPTPVPSVTTAVAVPPAAALVPTVASNQPEEDDVPVGVA